MRKRATRERVKRSAAIGTKVDQSIWEITGVSKKKFKKIREGVVQ